MKILFKYPSRGRVDRFFDGLDSIYNNIADKHNFHVACTLDVDDMLMNNVEVGDRIRSYGNISIQWGLSENKIHAINRDVPDINFDILVVMSDDVRFNIYGFDEMMRVEMKSSYPSLDGLLHFYDQDAKDKLAILYVAGKKWFEFRGNKIYHPSYKSYFCDNEEMEVAKILGKYKNCGYQILDHLCPGWGRAEKDELYLSQEKDWEIDHINYIYRQSINYGY